MEERYEYMWQEYTFGRLPVDEWIKFAEKYLKWWNSEANKEEE